VHPPNRRRPQHPVNRRRPRPSPARAAAHRRGLALREQLRRLGVWLCALPRHLRDSLATKPTPTDSAAYGRIPQPWDRHPADPGFERRPTEYGPADPGFERRPTELGPADPGFKRRPTEPGPRDDRRTAPYPGLEQIDLSQGDDRSTAEHAIELSQRDDRPASRPAAEHAIELSQRDDRPASRPAAERAIELSQRDDRPASRPAAVLGLADRPAPRTTAELGHRAAELGRRVIPQATALGRQLAPRAAILGRQLGTLGRTGALATGRGMRAAGRRLVELRPLLGLLRRFFVAVGVLTLRLFSGLGDLFSAVSDGLVRHRDVVFALLTRVMWWGALALLLLGGRALVEIHGRAPLDQQALPAFAAGLGLCALLVLVAAQARLRWAALVLGFSHGGLLALVWVVAAAI
jgi:hypothetical protein